MPSIAIALDTVSYKPYATITGRGGIAGVGVWEQRIKRLPVRRKEVNEPSNYKTKKSDQGGRRERSENDTSTRMYARKTMRRTAIT
jgi:hypothetical protein